MQHPFFWRCPADESYETPHSKSMLEQHLLTFAEDCFALARPQVRQLGCCYDSLFEGHGPTLLINENLSLFVLLAALPQVNLLSINKNDALRPLSQTKLYCTL